MSAATKRRARRAIDFQFVAVPVALLKHEGLTGRDLLVFSTIHDNARRWGGSTRLSNGTIARILGVCAATVSRSIQRLRDAGLIRCHYLADERVRTGITPLWPPPDEAGEEPAAVELPPPWIGPHDVSEGEKYSMYLCSREWGVRREAVRKRCGGTCERCGDAPMSHVHHLTYRRRYAEPLEDLMGVCEPCHDYIHGRSGRDPKPAIPAVDPFASFSVVA